MRFIALFLCLVLPVAVFAANAKVPPKNPAQLTTAYQFENAFLRATPDNSAGYVTIINPTNNGDILTAANADWTDRIELHDVTMDKDGVMNMVKKNQFDVPAKGKLVFTPGSKHLMIFGLKKPLHVGQSVSMKFVFRDAGSVTVPFVVKPASYMGGSHDSH
jgi:copper(I)-binding protein